MNILIVLGSITPNDDANTNIAKIVAAEMQKEGHSVELLGMCFQQCPKEEVIDGIKYHRIVIPEDRNKAAIGKEYTRAKNSATLFPFFIRHPLYSMGIIEKHFRAMFHDEKKALYVKELRRITRSKRFGRIIAITSPFYVLEAVFAANIGTDIVWYQLDPNHSNITKAYLGKTDLLSRELDAYRQIKFAVIPRLIFAENQNNTLSQYADKMIPVEFPNVRPLAMKPVEDDVFMNKRLVNLLFCGTFYEDIRNPEPLLELLSSFEDDTIVLHIIGGGCLDKIELWCNKTNRIVYHGYHSLQASVNAMLQADVLVNIDNSAANMLPSKINDYISACKPILNLYPGTVSNCREYLRDYPVHSSVCILNLNKEHIRKGIEEFCITSKEAKISFDDILARFPFSTPEYVTKQLLKEIK